MAGMYAITGMLSPGSFSNAETYTLNASEKNVVDAIYRFRTEHPDYTVPDITIDNKPAGNLIESEGRKKERYWYSVYFYYKKENQIVFTLTKPLSKSKTELSFVSINEGLDLGHWKEINHDYSFFENRKIKKTFEERILNEIKLRLQTK